MCKARLAELQRNPSTFDRIPELGSERSGRSWTLPLTSGASIRERDRNVVDDLAREGTRRGQNRRVRE